MADDSRDGQNGLSGEGMIGFGYATPFLRREPTQGKAAAISAHALDFALMPAPQGVMYWPRRRPARSALVEETALPLTNGFAERLLVIHALEHAPQVEELLREL
ncbi:MAG: hypothetical protein R3360_01235, partial [Alphaproteobacteria bacterium]|nr:hypothetical protein [Alphaproteobacteria bacterium]